MVNKESGFTPNNNVLVKVCSERGREEILPPNPPHVQLPLIKAVVEHLQGKAVCTCDGVSATPTNWVMDRILNKL
jgi:1,5-anhydro-D-fructose reductase (1,5-anhydro-D-mannitol-forming)